MGMTSAELALTGAASSCAVAEGGTAGVHLAAPGGHFIVVWRRRQGHQSTEVLFQGYIAAMSSRTAGRGQKSKPLHHRGTEGHGRSIGAVRTRWPFDRLRASFADSRRDAGATVTRVSVGLGLRCCGNCLVGAGHARQLRPIRRGRAFGRAERAAWPG